MQKFFLVLLLFSTVILSIHPFYVLADTFIDKGTLEIDGLKIPITYVNQSNHTYFNFNIISKYFQINKSWNSKQKQILIEYPDKRYAKIDVLLKKMYKDNLWSPINMILYHGQTYIAYDDLRKVFEHKAFYNDLKKKLYMYLGSFPEEGISLINKLPFNGFSINHNQVIFNNGYLPQTFWEMNGALIDFRMISEQTIDDTTEYKYAAFYLTSYFRLSQVIFIQRLLNNGDQMIFLKGYAGDDHQFLKSKMSDMHKIYASDAYIYSDKDQFKNLLSSESIKGENLIGLHARESIDQWYIFSDQNLNMNVPLIQEAWSISKSYHNSNTWLTEDGTYRATPISYQNGNNRHSFNINLQASSPLSIIEALQIKKNRLLEDFVHNAAFTLISRQEADGFWYGGINVAYLNRAYQLGPDYIDTRMSVDASMFLLKYGLLFNDKEAIYAGKRFKKYFIMMREKGYVYQINNGTIYPDYYSYSQSGKTLVSLNHSLYEMNYLYTLYNWFQDNEAKKLANEMNNFIDITFENWIKPDQDLYYALGPNGDYYGKDYINITYRDLFVTQAILKYMDMDDKAIKRLFDSKNFYLKRIDSTYPDSHLDLLTLFNRFDQSPSRKGAMFMSYPLNIYADTGNELFYAAYANIHFMKGIKEIEYNSQYYELAPTKKYVVIFTKGNITILDDPIM